MNPNMLERLENLLAALDQAETALDAAGMFPEELAIREGLDNASGIAGELLTMIDGR